MTEPASEQEPPLPPSLRFLKNLVTVLTITMILGIAAVVFLMVAFVNQEQRAILTHPDLFEFPAGVETVGYSIVDGYTVLVGDDAVIRVYATDTRGLVEEMDLND